MEKKFVHGQENLEVSSPAGEVSNEPTPENFDAYLPWACNQLEVYADIKLTRIQNNEYVSLLTYRSKSGKNRTRRKQVPSKTYLDSDEDIKENVFNSPTRVLKIRIYTVYDSYNNLVQLKFDNNIIIPTELLQVIGLFIQFQKHLTNVTINRGLNSASLYELNKMLQPSHVTDICLDNTVIPGANYDILLDNNLRILSLSRCKIEDVTVKKIAAKLTYPLATSKTLSILNLASNRITDAGAKYIAEMLRTNRQVVYLNLADNLITDDGSRAILDVLKEFPLSEEELIACRSRFIEHWQEKQKVPAEQPVEDKKINRRKPVKPSANTVDSARRNKTEKDSFVDPFSSKNTTVIDNLVYCYGNNHLSSLNLSYNTLSCLSVKTLLAVLKTQTKLDRTPGGLINISIEGNVIFTNCKELYQIRVLLEKILDHQSKHYQLRKRSQTDRKTNLC